MAKIDPQIHSSWKNILIDEFEKPYFIELKNFLLNEKASGKVIYPPGKDIFAAFNTTAFEDVKVVILGQDPYHGPGQANGLCFSVSPGVRKPPSLLNIFKEIERDLKIPVPDSGDLSTWARRGVLLLNATLTVESNRAASHQGKGWERFTDEVIRKLSAERDGLIFLLWGRSAGNKSTLIDEQKHVILRSVHPSPLSAHRGFIGCSHFSITNQKLREMGKQEIDWSTV
ncbi:MAG: uracil-DNA glycosylase [Bacteroidia bacterium]|nr:uracil-DNA glycosylase [Bacteroidia bacterium]